MRHASKGEPAGVGRAKMKRSVLAFPYSLRSSFVCPFSRSPPSCSLVVVCGISYRLARRLVLPSRSIVSFPVCLFHFRLVASRSSSRPLFSLLRLVVLLLFACFRFLTHSVRLRLRPRSSSSLSSSSSSSFVSCPCCLRCRFHSRHPSLPVIASLLPRRRCQLRSHRCPI